MNGDTISKVKLLKFLRSLLKSDKQIIDDYDSGRNTMLSDIIEFVEQRNFDTTNKTMFDERLNIFIKNEFPDINMEDVEIIWRDKNGKKV